MLLWGDYEDLLRETIGLPLLMSLFANLLMRWFGLAIIFRARIVAVKPALFP